METNYNKIKIALILNYLIVIFVLIASIIMFFDIKFMYGLQPKLDASSFSMFKVFTVDSNILMGISSVLLIIKERKLLDNKITVIPMKYNVIKLVGTVAVSLTFLVVIGYLAPISQDGIMSLLQNSNLLFHLIIPILSIITFCFFENTYIKFKYVFYGLLPTILYGIFYLTNVLTHIENGTISPKYDWYYFLQGGLHMVYFVVPIILFLTLVISVLLWIINRKCK